MKFVKLLSFKRLLLYIIVVVIELGVERATYFEVGSLPSSESKMSKELSHMDSSMKTFSLSRDSMRLYNLLQGFCM